MASRPSRPHVAVLLDLAVDLGGAETLAIDLLERMDPERFRRTLVAYRAVPADATLRASHERVVARLGEAGVDVLQLDRGGRVDLSAWRPFARLLRSGDVDVLHAHKHGPNLWATSFARVLPVPVVIAHEHTWSFEGQPLRRLLDRWAIATGCDTLLAVSELDRTRMETIERIPPERIRFLPNGIPAPSAPADARASVRAELAIPDDAPLVGTIGVLRPQKDLDTLLHAHVALLRVQPDARLVIVGDGGERERLEALATELGLAERVHFAGMRADATRFAAALDVAVNCSRFEGSSLAILEYMALARPIVATAVGGTPDLLGHGEAGSLVPASRPDTLAEAIAALLDDPAAAEALGRQARARQREHYDVDMQVRRLMDLYDELLAATRARRGPSLRLWRRAVAVSG